MSVLQLLGWLAYPLWLPIPLLTLNGLAAWQLHRAQDTYAALPLPPSPWHLPRVWFASAVLAVTAYVVGGFAVLAWQIGVLLLVWLSLPIAIAVECLVDMARIRSTATRSSVQGSGRRRRKSIRTRPSEK